MTDDNMKIEKRLENMKKFYLKAEQLIDGLPDEIPGDVKDLLKDKVLGDKELKDLMAGVDSHRPPRIFLIGRTGVGKSSLINALCNAYVAPISNIKSCTEESSSYQCCDGDRVLMDIFDTRGIAESESLNDRISAEEMLIQSVTEFSPDVAIMMLNCTHRDDVKYDVDFMKKLSKEYAEINSARLPIVVVLNKCDEMAPARHKTADEYPESKQKNIQEAVKYYKQLIVRNGLKIDDIVAVSSLIDWQTADGIEIDASSIENLPKRDIEALEISFDGRYQIQELLDILDTAILDFEAQMGLRMAARLSDVVRRVACHLNKIFSGISASVALSPIPVSDIYVLLVIQSLLVAFIASLGGRDISLSTAKEFILQLGGLGGLGLGFRLLAQQGTKLLNGYIPGVGSIISSSIAASGTMLIGKMAIAYYIDEQSLEDVKNKFL